MQDYSIGEVESLILKACRGAGFSWGLAQEAGNAAAWMAMHGLSAIDEVAALLKRIDRHDVSQLTPLVSNGALWSNSSGLLCPVITGAAFAECDLKVLDLNNGLVIKNVQQPLIALPSIVQGAILLQTDLHMSAGEYSIICDYQNAGIEIVAVPESAGADSVCADLEIQRAKISASRDIVNYQRATGTKLSIEYLLQLAHRTYVPATDASRNAGAGAGLLDND